MKLTDLGAVFTTDGVDSLMKDESFNKFTYECLSRYLDEDWGDLEDGDAEINNDALKYMNDRIVASYNFPEDNDWNLCDDKLWIITEADFSKTTILFPSEY